MPVEALTRLPSTGRTVERRIAAIVLPSLLCELAAQHVAPVPPSRVPPSPAQAVGKQSQPARALPPGRVLPMAVILDERPSSGAARAETTEEWGATSILSAVNPAARRLGVREGQTLAEARALSTRLLVRSVPRAELELGLGRLAELAMGFGATASLASPDTVWVDLSGSAHLFGGEVAAASELVARIRDAGHQPRVAIANGPLLAQAVARYGELTPEGFRVVPSRRTAEEMATLPVRALGLSRELESWFIRLGVLSVGELLALPESALSARLGDESARVLELARGRDASPLLRYEPQRSVIEDISWEEPTSGSEPLLFALRGLVARVSARLAGRGEAAKSLLLHILADPAIARFRKVALVTTLEFTLPKPLYREQELRRIVSSRLERVQLSAPSLGLRLEVPELLEATPRQLELGPLLAGVKADAADELPLVLAELSSDLGENRVGVLRAVDAHRPELSSELVSALPNQAGSTRRRVRKARPLAVRVLSVEGAPSLLQRLTRLLVEPLAVDVPLRVGATLVLDRLLYTIESLHFEQRLEAVEWWTRAVHRDYVHVVLRGSDGVLEALMFVDRETGKRYLHGILD